ncbi:MAG: S4 domain-containing protein, partial [Kiritimatiellia bacterium]
ALLVAAGLAESNGAARRLVQQGAVKYDGQKITAIDAEFEVAEGKILQAGKRGIVKMHLA